MGKFKIKWNSERILSLSAMSVSFLTLIIFIYQTNLMSRQNYLSILPYLQLSTFDDQTTSSFALSLKNHGVGPAIFESLEIEYKGKQYNIRDYDYKLIELLSKLHPALDSLKNFSFSTLERGIAIPPNTTYSIISVTNDPENYRLLVTGFDFLLGNGLKYALIYRSLQDERWVIHDSSEGPEKID